MEKEKVKARLSEATAKAKVALSEIKVNFKADEGTTGFPKVKSMFVNLWKSGNVGRGALVGAAIVFVSAILFLVPTVTGKNRVQEILELAEKSAKVDHNINFGGFFVGMSRHDLSALREYYKLDKKDCSFYCLGTIAGEKAVWQLTFSHNGVRCITNSGDTFDELAETVAKNVGKLDHNANFNTGDYWYERKNIDGTVLILNKKGMFIKNETIEKREPIETTASKAEREAKIQEFESHMGTLLPDLINNMVAIPGESYKVGKYEVTQAQWEALMENNPSNFKDLGNPVDSVSWRDCRDFINRLNLLSAVKDAGLVFRLPSDTEWRNACRADSNESYAEYCKLADGTQITKATLGEVAWYYDNSGDKPHPVGQKKPNAFGLYDMLGNVSEWTGSTDDSDITPIDRGGCYGIGASDCKSSFGYNHGMDYKHKTIGLRLFATTRSK